MEIDVKEVKRVNYVDILNKGGNFISLDISVNSTGWVCQYDNICTWGTYSLKEKNNRKRRREFCSFLTNLVQGRKFDFIVIEDVIAGCNFKTTRSLTELNILVEELMDFGSIPDVPVFRRDNKEWKRELKLISQDEVGIKGSDDKETICFCLNSLGFNPIKDTPQDVYDAMGIALTYIVNKDNISPEQIAEKVKKLHTDLTKGYVITQYSSKEAMLAAADGMKYKSRKPKDICYVEYDSDYKSLVKQFVDVVYSNGDDKIFCFHSPLNKIGAMAITYGFNLSADDVYFIAKRR